MKTLFLRIFLLLAIVTGINTTLYGAAVGSIPASFSTNSYGASVYTIPIDCLPGVNGMQPSISLTYNSLSGNGVAGWGWNLTGIPAIMRTPKTKFYDNVEQEIQWTKEDPLVLDGQRLIPLTVWTDSTEYRLENDPTFRIRAYGINQHGPSYLKVWTKSGEIMTYGNPSNPASYTLVYENAAAKTDMMRAGWNLVEVEDANGNYLVFDYANSISQILRKITYGGNKKRGTVGKLTLNFMYAAREDAIGAFISGRESLQKLRLSKINSAYNGVVQKEYRLTYKSGIKVSRLESVTLYDRGVKQYEPLKFTYGEAGTPGEFSTIYQETTKKPYLISADLNGDGKNELRTIEYPTVLLRMQGLMGDFNGNGSVDQVRFSLSAKKLHLSIEDQAPGMITVFSDIVRMDKEIDKVPFATIGSFIGNPLSNLVIIYDDPEELEDGTKFKYTYDMIVRRHTDGVIFRYNKNMSFTLPSKIEAVHAYKSTSLNYRDDLWLILADGTSRILKNTRGDYECFTNSELINTGLDISKDDLYTFGDYNGDGLMDVIYRKGNKNTMDVAINKGAVLSSGTQKYRIITTLGIACEKNYFEGENDRVFIMDINNDDLPDIITASEESTTRTLWRFYLNQGNGQFHCYFEFVPDRAAYSCWGDHRETGNMTWARYNTEKKVIIKDPGYTRKCNLLTKVENSLTEPLVIKYKPHSKANYKNETPKSGTALATYINSGYIQFRTSMLPVVSETSDGRNVITYDYSGSSVNWNHRGYMGFLYQKEFNTNANLRLENENKILQSGTANLMVPSTKKYYLGKTGATSFKGEFYTYTVYSHGGKRYTLQQSELSHYDTPSHRAGKDTFTWDDLNNLTKKVSVVSDSVTITTTMAYNKYGAWCKNKPYSEVVTEQYGSAAQTRTLRYVYDSRGNLATHYTDYGVSGALTIQYASIDDFGQATVINHKAKSQTRAKTLTYSDDGRFIVKEADHLGQQVTRIWDEARALLSSETTRIGTTTYAYDQFGGLVTTTHPNGKKETEISQWASDGAACPISGCKYLTTHTVEGSSPVTTWYNKYGQEIARKAIGVGNRAVYMYTQYMDNGRIWRVSKPTFDTSPTDGDWAQTYEYTSYGRISKITTPQGVTTISSRITPYVGDNVPMRLETTNTPDGKVRSCYYDDTGLLVKSVVNGKEVVHTYTIGGKMKSATPEGGLPVTFQYDRNGNRIQINDPNSSIITSEYDAWGQLVKETQNIHQGGSATVTSYTYLANGLLSKKTCGSTVTNYVYDSNKRIQRMYTGEASKEFVYDNFDRITQTSSTVKGRTLVTRKSYDVYGRKTMHVYPSGLAIWYYYDQYGNLIHLEDREHDQYDLWYLVACDAQGRVLKERKGNVETTYSYNEKDQLTSIVAPGVVNMQYTYAANGNLKTYEDLIYNQKVSYSYDNMDRLIEWEYGPGSKFDVGFIDYDSKGRISYKGNYRFTFPPFNGYYENEEKPNMLTSVSYDERPDNTITYTDFKKVKSIREGSISYDFVYGPDEERWYMKGEGFCTPHVERYYAEDYEEGLYGEGWNYIYAGNRLVAVYLDLTNDGKAQSVYTDIHGSLVALAYNTDIKERYAYDPWGNRRKADNWSLRETSVSDYMHRGYTMHEHLDPIGLINMNARLYDPFMSTFLSPDPQLQDPGNWMNYNRYTYCMNNPLKYTDPSGEVWWIPVLIGAVVGGYVGYKIGEAHGAKGWDMVGYVLGGAVVGGVSAGAGAGVSSLGAAGFWAGAAGGAIAGVGFSGLATDWNGRAMWQSGALGALIGWAAGGIGSGIGGSWGSVTAGSITSGFGSMVAGGNGGDILGAMLAGGAMAYGTYELTTYLGYRFGGRKLGGFDVKYKAYRTIQADFHRSRMSKEYGGLLMKDGRVIRVPKAYRHSFGIDMGKFISDAGINIEDIQATYHTHWARPGTSHAVNENLDKISEGILHRASNGPSNMDYEYSKTSGLTGILIDRTSVYIYGEAKYFSFNLGYSNLLRYHPLPYYYYNY